jgi:hypothetical protein
MKLGRRAERRNSDKKSQLEVLALILLQNVHIRRVSVTNWPSLLILNALK